MKIYLIGVSHDFQTEFVAEFVKCILRILKWTCIRSIGEEMNQDALIQGESIPRIIADKLGMRHKYCDPNELERQELGILGDQAIKARHMLDIYSAECAAALTLDNHSKRERIWLKRIKHDLVEPVLFICGIDHLDTFVALSQKDGHDCRILKRKFSSCKPSLNSSISPKNIPADCRREAGLLPSAIARHREKGSHKGGPRVLECNDFGSMITSDCLM